MEMYVLYISLTSSVSIKVGNVSFVVNQGLKNCGGFVLLFSQKPVEIFYNFLKNQ